MQRLALFDLDNTLVDRSAAFRRWAAEFCADRHLPDDALAWLIATDRDGGPPPAPAGSTSARADG
ncbi:hypothetical protein ACFY3U_07165 [Micromonospora sp. NPDC000089]|uniref:hypothetical protein n=1 Tax=unclassified Micromonospora TaxID=2617518 RepID=UPI0036B6C095